MPGDAVSDALSIFGAAADAGVALALVDGERRHTFADLARLAQRRLDDLRPATLGQAAVPIVGRNSVEAIVTLYALLELRAAALLLHPKATAAEHAAEIGHVAAHAGLPAGAAVIVHTSGTTGRARGAVLTRDALLASARASAANLGWHDDDCWGLAMPLARVGGLSIVTRCLAARRAVALAPAFDAAQLPRWIDEQRVTLLSLVPTMLAMLLDAHPRWQPPPHLRAVLLGGDAAPAALRRRAAERGLPIVVTYGCTETCSQVAATPYALRFDAARGGVGPALPGAELRVDDGRILVRGPMRMAGYVGEPALAADAWFDTGDLGALGADGWLHVHGRRADVIVTGGENVYPAEVERVLEALPGIDAAAVFGLADELWGQTVAAALVAPGPRPRDTDLAALLRERLAPHKRPRRIAWVDALPKTPAGKLDRAALPALAHALRPPRD